MEMDWKSLITILWVFTGSAMTVLKVTDRKKDRIIDKLNEELKLEKEKTKNSENERKNLETEYRDMKVAKTLEMDRLKSDLKLKEDIFKIKLDNEIENNRNKAKTYEDRIKQLENIIKENDKNKNITSTKI